MTAGASSGSSGPLPTHTRTVPVLYTVGKTSAATGLESVMAGADIPQGARGKKGERSPKRCQIRAQLG
jgi:hypothetical protein